MRSADSTHIPVNAGTPGLSLAGGTLRKQIPLEGTDMPTVPETDHTTPLSVYLAGRITNHERDWRRHIIENVATTEVGPIEDYPASIESSPGLWAWDSHKCVIPGVGITGPFFIEGEGHDGMHGDNTHGVGDEYQIGTAKTGTRRDTVVKLCRRAIASSDLVYCWLEADAREAYGTLWELGYAAGLGKPIIIASATYPVVPEDLWFAAQNANLIYARNPLAGLLTVAGAL